MSTPLRAWRTAYGTSRLIGLRMDVLWQWRPRLVRQSVSWLALKQCQPCFDMDIVWIEVSRSCVRIQGVTCLIIARLVLCWC
jgi:hypothetical protein